MAWAAPPPSLDEEPALKVRPTPGDEWDEG
jgi:hypothetical protein